VKREPKKVGNRRCKQKNESTKIWLRKLINTARRENIEEK
jgi:hypothetical protein